MSFRKNSRGFSLIEVLVAMMIFAGAIMIINNVWSANLLRIRKSRMMNEVSLLLQQKVTELELKYKDKPHNEIPDTLAGTFGSQYPEFSWKMEAKKFEMPDLSAVMSAQEGGVDETTVILVKTMTDFINKSVKEMKVSVVAKLGRKKVPREYSVTTLLVTYDQEISIPGIGGGAGGGDSE